MSEEQPLVKKSNRGRKPGKIDEETLMKQEALLKAITLGQTKASCLERLGIAPQVFRDWIYDTKGIYGNFKERYLNARQEFLNFHLENIRQHAKVDWKASAWLLQKSETSRREFMDEQVNQPQVNIQINNSETQEASVKGLLMQLQGQTPPSLSLDTDNGNENE